MQPFSNLINVAVVMILFCSCNDNGTNKHITGHWKAVQWQVEGKPSNYDISNTSFTFDSTGNYTFVYGGNTEKGTYKIENDQLFTTPANESEMMVKIAKSTADSLVFEMNRGGQAEELTLVRGDR